MKEIFTIAILTLVIGYLWYDNNELTKEVKQFQVQNDTLRDGLYQCQLELLRYSFALENFNKNNPKAAQEFNYYYENESE
jgi:hypothetical protein